MTATTTIAAPPDSPAVFGIVPATRPAGAVATATAVASRTLRVYMRSPQLLVFGMVNAVTFMVLFRYVFGGSIEIRTVDYVDFLLPGFVLTWVLISGVGAAAAVAEDVDQGFHDRLRSLPVSRMALLTGRALADTAIVAWGLVFTTALGFVVGFRLEASVGEGLLALGLCVVCGFAFTWLFICMGLVAGNAQSAQGMSFLVFPFVFVSSAYVQVDSLPGWMQPVAEHQPMTVMSNAVRSLALGDPALAGVGGHTTAYWIVLSLVWAAGLVAVFAPLAVSRYRRST